MEMHLVHRNEAGQLAVVGVLMGSGSENSALREIWAHVPEEKSPARTIAGVLIDAGDLLPADTSYYRYMGSLTTPPCSEGVSWFVLAGHVTVGRSQLAELTKLSSLPRVFPSDSCMSYPVSVSPVCPYISDA